MSHPLRRALAALLLLLLTLPFAPITHAQDSAAPPDTGRDDAFEAQIAERLSEINPEAVPLFRAATQALDTGAYQQAREGFQQVLALAPDFPDALRRLAYAEAELGDLSLAVKHARLAAELDKGYASSAGLAQVLLETGDPANYVEALTHAQAAARTAPQDPGVNEVLLLAALANEDLAVVREASARLMEADPDNPAGFYVGGLFAADDGQWEEAERLLLRARDLGVPADEIQSLLDEGIRSQARLARWLRWGEYALVAWLASLIVLFLAGLWLSRLTLSAVQRAQQRADAGPTNGERRVRELYRLVILFTGVYFYVSIPFLIAVLLAAGAGAAYLFLSLGRIPVRLAIFIGLVIIYSLYAIVRSVFTRVRTGEPGRRLPREEAPALWALAEEAAQRVGTRPVDAIFLTPGPEIAVTESGTLLSKLQDRSERQMILGLGALRELSQGQLKAILAHEYGHFSNRDTAGGNLAAQVLASMRHMAYRLARSGVAKWYNPAWLFLNGYYRVFLRVTLGASRLQEILADRLAVMSYGAQNFVDGLKNLVRASFSFNAIVSEEMGQALKDKRDPRNLYLLEASETYQGEVEKAFDAAMQRPTSPYDSHPAPAERIVLAEAMRNTPQVEDVLTPTWELLPGAEDLQLEMTELVRKNVRVVSVTPT